MGGVRVAVAAFVAVGATGCTHGAQPLADRSSGTPRSPTFVAAPTAFRAQCRVTARAVGYPVPCPLWVPRSFVVHVEHGDSRACRITIVCPGTGPWRGWVEGTTQSWNAHLAIQASPHPVRDDAKLVYGPEWYPRARVEPLASMTVGGNRVRAVLVPSGSESVFGDHVVLIWTVGRHTYGVGFHNFAGIRPTLRLDEELIEHIALVRP